MSFDSREASLADGAPLHLYDFARGTVHWRYTGADRDLVYGGLTYSATAISDDGARQTGQTTADLLTITAPHDIAVAQQFRVLSPSMEVSLTRFDLHYGEPEALVSWVGSIVSVSRPTSDSCRIGVRTLAASFDRPGLSLGWERGCPYAVYDHNCTLNPDSFKLTTVLASLSPDAIESALFDTFPDGYFDGGYVEWDIEGGLERRGIESHAAGVLILFGGTYGLSNGQSVRVFPGCPQTIAACDTKFGNLFNYGGFPAIPGKSPFDGDPAFS